jgi:CTP-dependent riboflavin kinase
MIKFRQKVFTENESTEKGGLLAPILAGSGVVLGISGINRLRKANILKDNEPELLKNVKSAEAEKLRNIKKIKNSWFRTGRFFRKDSIRKATESGDKAIENEMRKVRKASRSAKWNKAIGKSAIGLGIGAAALGAYKLNKQIKRNKED